MPEERRRWKITNFFRKSTPVPADREVYQMGIQERHHPLMMTGPIVYHIADNSVILRTCITQLKNEIFKQYSLVIYSLGGVIIVCLFLINICMFLVVVYADVLRTWHIVHSLLV